MENHLRIGIIGGLSAESTASYYLEITRSYVRRFGNCGYPEIILFSVNLERYHRWRDEGRWDLITEDLAKAAKALHGAGADFALIATNTMHKVFDDVARSAQIPFIHILDPVIKQIRASSMQTVGLLGTRYTMQETFYKERLSRNGIDTLVPEDLEQVAIHRIIVDELVKGQILDGSRKTFQRIIEQLAQRGAKGVILGCTEIPLLIQPKDSVLPLFDTVISHAQAALERALGEA